MRKNKGGSFPKVVVIGGGTGVFTVLSGLRNYPLDLTAVVTMADDGGSTGALREEFGILPPGDVRRALVAMAHSNNRLLSDLFNYRFEEGSLRGHAFGNIMLTALERVTGSFEEAINEAGRVLRVSGRVLPVTLESIRLAAELENGAIIRGETNIDIPKHDGRSKIRKVWLEPGAEINPRVREAILGADMVIVGPGDLYSSIIPNLLVKGMGGLLKKTRAKKVYVVSVMTKWGETGGFTSRDFIDAVERYVGKNVVDYTVVNTKRPSVTRLEKYAEENASFVERGEFAKKPTPIFGDFIRRSGFVRHDPEKLAKVLVSLI